MIPAIAIALAIAIAHTIRASRIERERTAALRRTIRATTAYKNSGGHYHV